MTIPENIQPGEIYTLSVTQQDIANADYMNPLTTGFCPIAQGFRRDNPGATAPKVEVDAVRVTINGIRYEFTHHDRRAVNFLSRWSANPSSVRPATFDFVFRYCWVAGNPNATPADRLRDSRNNRRQRERNATLTPEQRQAAKQARLQRQAIKRGLI